MDSTVKMHQFILANACDFGTYDIFSTTHANAQNRLKLCCSLHTHSMLVDVDTELNIDTWSRCIRQHVRLKRAVSHMRYVLKCHVKADKIKKLFIDSNPFYGQLVIQKRHLGE